VLKGTLLLWILSDLIVLVFYHIAIHRFHREEYRHVNAIGISCVAFGWMTIMAQMTSSQYLDFLGFIQVPVSLAPFSSLILTQFIVPQASFLGHLAGILAGFLISWHVFDWFSDWLFWCTIVWLVVGLAYSQKAILLPSSISASSPTPISGNGNIVRIENGVIVRSAPLESV